MVDTIRRLTDQLFQPPGDPARALTAVADASADAIHAKDLTGRIVAWSRGAERLYGYTAGEMIGEPLSRLIPPDRAGEIAWILDRLRAGYR